MRIIELKQTGSIPFPNGVSWKPGDDEKIALIGDNGSGKTTLLDTLCMAFYGMTPNRESDSGREEGSIYGCFKGKDSSVEARIFIKNKEIHAKRLINPVTRKQKPYLYVNGKAVTEGKIDEFDAAFLKETGLSKEIFLSTVYHSQKGKGHLASLGQNDARSLLDQILGFGQYDTEFTLVDKARLALEKDLAGDNYAITELETRIAEKGKIEAEFQEKSRLEVKSKAEIVSFEQSLKVSNQTLADLKSQSYDLAKVIKEKSALQSEIAKANESKTDITNRMENNRKLLSDADSIRENAKLLKVKSDLLELKNTELHEAKSQYETEANSLKSGIAAYRNEIESIEKALTNQSVMQVNSSSQLSKVESQIASLESKLVQFQNKASLLDRVPCSGVTVNERVLSEECELLKDAVQGKKEIASLEVEIKLLKTQKDEFSKAIGEIETKTATFESEKEKCIKFRTELEQKLESLPVIQTIQELEKQTRSLQQEIPTLQEKSKNLAQLDLAEERIQDYAKQIKELESTVVAKQSRLDELAKLIESKSEESKAIENAEKEISRIESEIAKLKDSHTTLIKEISKLEEKLSEIAKAETKLATLKKSDKAEKLRGLKLLCEGLSPKGARALKLDAAGPGISASINSVLSACYGTRFQVFLRTTKETGKGDLKEDVSIMVLDEETGDESLVGNKSGGQASIIKEGISLGAAVYQQQQSGIDIKTLIRDEADGGLTKDNAVLYQKMLDRAMSVGGFEQVIYVSHKPEVQYLANRIDKVESGKVLVGATK